jgi:hypothetical protein
MTVHLVRPGAKRRGEEPVSYYSYAPGIIRRIAGRAPSRQALSKYRTEGFPVFARGPRVVIPTYKVLNQQVMTTKEAMDRWLKKVREVRDAYTNGAQR